MERGLALVAREIFLWKNSYIGRDSGIASEKGYKVSIGDNCSITHFVMIYTMNYIADQDLSKERNERILSQGDVIIGDNCWIDARVFITENTKIRENSVIGANSVVTHDIPHNAMAMGTCKNDKIQTLCFTRGKNKINERLL